MIHLNCYYLSAPTEPQELRVIGCTTTQLKVGWEPPEFANGHIKGYYVYNGKSEGASFCSSERKEESH